MSRFPAIPDFNDAATLMATVRAMKDIIEQMAGLRQGNSRGSPQIFVQEAQPAPTRGTTLSIGDLWVKTPGGALCYYTGVEWKPVA